MDLIAKNIRDGIIEKTVVEQSSVCMKIDCASVESGELTMEVSILPHGRIHLHFSGLGDKVIKTVGTSANGVDVLVTV